MDCKDVPVGERASEVNGGRGYAPSGSARDADDAGAQAGPARVCQSLGQSGSNQADDQQHEAKPPFRVVDWFIAEAGGSAISVADKWHTSEAGEIGNVGFVGENRCAICFATKTKKCVFLNCFHSSCCFQCALEIMNSEKVSKCPICRSPIVDVKEIYD